MSLYPNAIYEPRTKENKAGIVYDPAQKTIGYAEDVVKLDDEVVALETELGTNPKGVYASVAAFLSDLLSKVISVFTDLSDVPSSYSGQAGKVAAVKATEDGLEFITAAGGGGDMTKVVYDTDNDGVVDNSQALGGSTKAQVQDHAPNAHNTSHQDGGADEISVAGLSGELADNQPPKSHNTSHQDGGADEISVAGLSGELADNQKSTFLKLSDTPASYVGQAAKVVKVKATEDGLEFIVAAGGGQTLFDAIVAPSGGDYTLLSAAIAAGKKRIFVRAGTYIETVNITVPSDATIIGENPENTIINFNNQNYAFNIHSKNNVLVANITVKGRDWNGTVSVFDMYGSSNIIVENCVIRDTNSSGIKVSNSSNVIIRNCRFSGINSGYSIWVLGNSAKVLIEGNFAICSPAIDTAIVWLETISEIIVANNSFEKTANASHVVRLYDTVNRCIISGNKIKGVSGTGLDIRTAACNKNIIIGNQFINVSYLDSGTGTVITGNAT